MVSLRTRLIASTALAMATAAPAQAQQAAADDGVEKAAAAQSDAADSDDIIVVGVREALEAAAVRKRNSDTVVDSITATDIGSFPDKSVAEALQRVPGITVARTNQGDATHYPAEPSLVIIRGLTQTRSEINGRDSFSASAGYGLNFADVSADLLSGVDTYKNQTADMIEGGIAGTVNLRTRLPFDQKGNLYALSATGNYGTLSKNINPEISALLSGRLSSELGEFGVMVSGAYSKLTTISQGALVARYAPFAPGVFGPGINYIPSGFIATQTRYNRERKGVSAAFQWESPSGNLLLTAQYNNSKYDNIANENNFTTYWAFIPQTTPQTQLFTDRTFIAPPTGGAPFSFFPNGSFRRGVVTSQGFDRGFTDANGNYVPSSTAQFGVLPDGRPYIRPCTQAANGNSPCQFGSAFNTQTRYIADRRSVADKSLNLKWKVTDRVTATIDYQNVSANSRSDDTTFNLRSFADIDLNLEGEFPTVRLLAPSNYNTFGSDPYNNSANYSPESIMDHITDSGGELEAFRGDVSYKVESNWIDEVRVGARYANRRQQHNWSAYNWQSIAADWNANPAESFFVDSGPAFRPDGTILFQGYEPGFYESRSFGTEILDGGVLNRSQFIFPTDEATSTPSELARRFSIRGQTDEGGEASSRWNPICDRPNEVMGSCFTPGEMLDVTERTKSAYAMIKFGGADANLFGSVNIRGNIGLRWVETTVKSKGGTTFGEAFNITPADCLALTPQQAAALAADPYLITPACLTVASTNDAAFSSGRFVGSTITTKHTNFLPSFNIRFELDRNWLVRFAASRAISKPDMGLLKNFSILQRGVLLQTDIVRGNPNLVLDAQGRPVSYNFTYGAQITNPRLKPIKANQFDLSAEYYSNTAGSFSITGFYKKFFDYIQNGTFNVPFTNNGVTRNVTAIGPVNGDGASIYGMEVAYQRYFNFLPAPFDGLGVQLNFTKVWNSGVKNTNLITETNPDGGGTATALSAQPGRINPGRLEQLSDNAFNAVLLYEKGPVGLRVAYNWRSRYLDSVNDCCLGFPVWHTAEGFLDASFRFALTRNVEFNLQGSNLLSTKIKTEAQVRGPTDTNPNQEPLFLPGSTFETDRRILAGVRIKL